MNFPFLKSYNKEKKNRFIIIIIIIIICRANMGLRLGLMVKYKHYWRKKSHRLASHGDWCYSYIHCNILDKADLICDASVFHLHGCICFRQLFRCPLFVSSNVYCPSLYCVIYVCLVVAVAMLTMQQKNQTLYRWDGRPVAQWYWTRPPISGNFNGKRTKLNKGNKGSPRWGGGEFKS
jgi:hypothetical protein